MTFTKAFVVATAVALVATPLAAKSLLDPLQDGAVEVIRPSAAGQPKRYTAQVSATCQAGVCTAEFGKKNGKERPLDALTFLIYSNGKNVFASINFTYANITEFFLQMASNIKVSSVAYTVYAWTKNFPVASGLPLNVVMQTSGNQAISICTANGTIR